MPIAIRSTVALALALTLGAIPMQAQQAAARPTRPAPSLSITPLNVTAAEAASKSKSAPRTSVLPNDVLRYTLTFTNSTDGAVRNVELRDPIPAGLHFLAGSARASRPDARLEFSADGGRSWSAAPTESVMVDGRSVVRAVPANRFTHLRWVVTGAVAPHAVVTGSFDTRVGGA